MQLRKLSPKLHLSLFLIPLLLSSCKSIGPWVLNSDRYSYNVAMNESTKQELLLNIVRLRYDDNPMSIKVGNISGSTNFSRGLALFGQLTIPPIGPYSGLSSMTPAVTYADNPIISYTPLSSEQYTKQYLSALELKDLALLLQSSWSVPRVFRVTLQSAGTSRNAPSAARPTSSRVPEFQDFINMTYVLRRLQIDEQFFVTYQSKKQHSDLIFNLTPHYTLSAAERKILKKAGVEVYKDKIIFSDYIAPHKAYIVTRSVLGIVNYLSKGLVVPEDDLKKGFATKTVYANGKLFDWDNVVRGMMKIYHSDKPPIDAAVSVPYRNKWFYIKDNDSNSKQTLILLQNIAGLIEYAPITSESQPLLSRTT